MLLEFFLKILYSTMCGKNVQIYKFTFLENALVRDIFTHASPHSILASKFLLSRPRQTEIIHSPRQHSFENLFPQTAKRGGGNYNLLYQNSIRKYEDDLQHLVFYILYHLQFFQMWWLYGFVNNIHHIVWY